MLRFRRSLLNRLQLRSLFIQTEPTPNDDALIFRPGRPVLPDSSSATVEFTSPQQAARKSRLATEIFSIQGVQSVLFGPDFISVNKRPDALWIHIKPQVYSALMDQFTMHKDEPVIQSEAHDTQSSLAIQEGDSEIVKAIKEILEARVRPVIQGDGGDLSYEGFDDKTGTVSLALQGACRSCSSSALTLKNGIENMLKFYVPEVKQVLQVENEAEQISEQEFKAFEQKHYPKSSTPKDNIPKDTAK